MNEQVRDNRIRLLAAEVERLNTILARSPTYHFQDYELSLWRDIFAYCMEQDWFQERMPEIRKRVLKRLEEKKHDTTGTN